jgi:serine/threonine-protein kinase
MVALAAWSGPAQPEYETLLELGEGGMAVAYLARTLGAGGFERWVVLKRLNLELAANPEAIERFLGEARVAARIHHANVVGTQHVGRDNAGPFIVLDYVEGGALDELVNAGVKLGNPLGAGVLLRIALDALAGLQAVHDATDPSGRPLEILHRDISLENVLVSVHDGVARLADFGVARSVLSPVRTSPGYFVGKLLYLAPEYLKRKPVGATLDLYALGVTLWLALAGERPWRELGDGQIVSAIVEEGFPPLPAHVNVPSELRALIARACDRDPTRRFQSARAMTAAIEALDREHGWVASHAEVAECVELLLGQSLRRRRHALAERGRARTPEHHAPSAERQVVAEAATELPAAATPHPNPSPSSKLGPERTIVLPVPAAQQREPASVVRRSRRSRTAILAGTLAVVAAIALLAALLIAHRRNIGAPTAVLGPIPPPPAITAPAPPAPTLVPLPALSAAPTQQASTRVPTVASTPPRAPRQSRAATPAAAPVPHEPAAPTVAPPPPAVDGIQKRNPYR